MKLTIRCIVLVSACSLWSACQEPKPDIVTRERTAPLTPAKLAQPDEALTAAAPMKLKSVADVAPALPVQKSEPAKESVPPKAEDFDRALTVAEVKVERFVLAHDVKGREPLYESDTFSTETKKIFAFVQLANEGAPYAFRVHWEPVEGPSVPYGVKLSVPTAERFRTWSWTAIERKPGRYRAVLRTLEGEEIASRELLITAADE
jgi:hypothetical protein